MTISVGMTLGTADYLMIGFIGLAIGWIASAMSSGGLLKNLIWSLIGAALGAFVLPHAGVNLSLGSNVTNLAAFTALGAAFCALVGQVLT